MTVRKHFRPALSLLFLFVLSLSLPSCAVNPATGQRQLVLMSESQEIALGQENHQQIMQQMGVYADPVVNEYVSALGLELAALSERPDLPWTFTVIDDPTVNAFALPGGFIYVTRGIMAHLNSEAELISVLGHEIGHVTGRHGVERLSKAQLMSVGLGVGMILSPELRQFGDLAQQSLGLLFLKYSRDDERQADELGLRYTVLGGWDAREMPEVFGVLKAVGDASGSGRLPGWLSTHPEPEARQARIGGMLAELDTDFTNAKRNREGYLGHLDNMMFGANPREGFFQENAFLHPDLEFRLTFPQGWKTQNQRQAVAGISEQQDAIVVLTLAQEADPETAARKFLSQEGVEAGPINRGKINGFPGAGADFKVTQEGGSLRGRTIFLRDGEMTYQLMGYTADDKWNGYSRLIDGFLQSYDRLRDRKALEVQPARLDLVRPRRDLTIQSFQNQFPSSIPLETIALINHIAPTGTLLGGLDAKRVIGGSGKP